MKIKRIFLIILVIVILVIVINGIKNFNNSIEENIKIEDENVEYSENEEIEEGKSKDIISGERNFSFI